MSRRYSEMRSEFRSHFMLFIGKKGSFIDFLNVATQVYVLLTKFLVSN
jgi:hypothetical protein